MNSLLFAILSEQLATKQQPAPRSSGSVVRESERPITSHRRSSEMFQRCGGGRRIIRKKLGGN